MRIDFHKMVRLYVLREVEILVHSEKEQVKGYDVVLFDVLARYDL